MSQVCDAAGLVGRYVVKANPHVLAAQYDREVLAKAVALLAERKRIVEEAWYITYES